MEDFFFIVDNHHQESLKLNNIIKTNLAKTIVIDRFEDLFSKLLSLHPSIILINKNLLDENNFMQLRELKSINSHIPIVIIYSAIAISEKSQVSLMKVGVDGFIHNLENPHWIVSYLNSLLNIKQHSPTKEITDQKYQMLFETMFSAYALHEIITDEDDNPINYKFIEVNPAYERITGLKAAQVVGKTVLDLFPETNLTSIKRYGEVAILGTKLQFEQFSVEHQKYFEIIAFSPQKGQFSTIFIDITQYKNALKAVQKSESELKEMNSTKDKFFSIIAHDLKNPFQGILGFVELLHNDLNEFSEAELKMVIEQVKEATENAYNLLLNLLEWSRLQLNRVTFSPKLVNLSSLAQQEIYILKTQAKAKNIEINLELEDETEVFADENMIRMIFRNLISNAIKFTDLEGTINISSNFLPKFIDIEIRDSGIGISQENIKKLFKINEQVVSQGTAKEKGTGLGLILCKEFIERNKGKIWVESKLGTGSSFHILLPSNHV